jgi:cellulose synthase/poly-beta-1,6-N-acetylglucosamine synthase-like glycosyltransferase
MNTDLLSSLKTNFSPPTTRHYGAVKIEGGQSLFDSMQSLEFSSLIGSGAATLAFGIPTMCNGANLAFRKQAFIDVDGYTGNDRIASGDDEFLMRKISEKFSGSIQFNNDQESIVITSPQATLSTFFHQRFRWAGKWKFHQDISSRLLAVFIFLFQLSVLTAPILVLSGYLPVTIFIAMIFLKAVAEYVFLRQINAWFQSRWSWAAFFCLQVMYPIYVVVVGIVSNVVNPVWKGRK